MSDDDLCPHCPLHFCAPWRPKPPRRRKRRPRSAVISAAKREVRTPAASPSLSCDDAGATFPAEKGVRHDS